MIIAAASADSDVDLTTGPTLLSHMPSSHKLMQGVAVVGDGSKDLDGTGGNFTWTVKFGARIVEPGPETVVLAASQVQAVFVTPIIAVPSGYSVSMSLLSPNAADTDVDVKSYWFDLWPATTASGIVESNVLQVSNDTAAADDLESFIEALGTDDKVLISTDAQDLSSSLDVNAKLIGTTAVDDILDEVIEGSYSLREMMRMMAAALLGKCSGGGTTTVTFRDTGDTTDRIVATVDAGGNRTSVTLDET